MRTGRNEPCHCGSGKKYKNCCIGEQSRKASRQVLILVAVVAAVAAAGLVPTLLGDKEPERGAVSSPRTPRAGQVWSEEHGHWHDAAAPAGGGAPVSPALTPLPPRAQQQQQQPRTLNKPQPGPAPEGKVWSPEHGHWHDVAK